MALRMADGFANAEDTSRRKTLRDLTATRSHLAEEITGGSRYSDIVSLSRTGSANA
jgi:hypothetical protein